VKRKLISKNVQENYSVYIFSFVKVSLNLAIVAVYSRVTTLRDFSGLILILDFIKLFFFELLEF
jgi:hypothetical protein